MGGQAVRDPDTRAQYDHSIAAREAYAEVAIWQEVDLCDFAKMSASPPGPSELFWFPCRCGGQYLLADSDLRDDAAAAVVPCDTCSLAVRVLYSVA